MKKTYIILISLATVLGCTPQDPKAQLEALRAQKAEIEAQIVELESTLGDSVVVQPSRVKVVEASSLTSSPFQHFIEVQGTVDTDQNVILTSQSGGTIEQIHVQEGQEVKKGQLLVSLDAQVLQNSIAEVRTSLSYATEIYTKQEALWEQKIGSEVQYLTAKNNKESLQHRLATLNEQLAMMRITSPIDGVIDNITAKMGELTSPGMPLGRVVNLSNFEIKADVAENYAGRIANGTPVILNFPDIKKEVSSEISHTGRVIDPVNRTFNVVVRLDDPDVQIKPNMVCVVKIVDFNTEDAIVIPVNTIQRTDQGMYVFIAENSGESYRAVRRKIETELEYNGNVMVNEGLAAGDMLITFGYQDLADGEIIRF